MRKVILTGLLLLSLVAQADSAGQLQIEDPYARAAIKQQRNSAAFMRLSNPGQRDIALVDAVSPVARVVELHTHINEDGVMRMRRVERIEISAGAGVVLKPGGYHVMLLGLKQDLKEGDELPLVLKFGDGSEKALRVPVRSLQKHHGKHMEHGALSTGNQQPSRLILISG